MTPAVVHDGPGELVVVKPAGLPVEAPRDPAADSLLRRLAERFGPELRLVHRLDAPACGLMLVARSAAAAAYYAKEIAARRWQKWYVARVAAGAADVHALIGAHKAYLRVDGRTAHVVRSGGKPAFLDVVATAPAPEHPTASHVLVRLHTGRYHQIRTMLAHLGAPLAGDPRYGGPPDRRLYLEQVVLGATVFDGGAWTVWAAPRHPDRERWAPTLTDAVAAVVSAARRAPPPPAPAP